MSALGPILRDVRLSSGISLRQFAKDSNQDVGYLSRVERGLQRLTPQVVMAYERAFGDVMDRRDLLRGVSAALVTPETARDMVFHAFDKAINSRSELDEWEERIFRYGQQYMAVGAQALQRHVTRDLVELQPQMDRPEYWGVAAKLMIVCGKGLPAKDGRSNPEAIKWYLLSAMTADYGGDDHTRVWVRARVGLALAYGGTDLEVADRMASEALAISNTPTLGKAAAHLATAHISACRGERRQAITAWAQAKRLYETLDVDQTVSEFNIPSWRFHTFESMLFARLGDRRALESQHEADHGRPDGLFRFATHLELHRGLMIVKSGDPFAGLSHARLAMAKLTPVQRNHSLQVMYAEIDSHARKLLGRNHD